MEWMDGCIEICCMCVVLCERRMGRICDWLLFAYCRVGVYARSWVKKKGK